MVTTLNSDQIFCVEYDTDPSTIPLRHATEPEAIYRTLKARSQSKGYSSQVNEDLEKFGIGLDMDGKLCVCLDAQRGEVGGH